MFGFFGSGDCSGMKPKSSRVPTTCRLEEQDRQALEIRADKLNTSVGALVEQYVIAGLNGTDAQTSIVAILKEFKAEMNTVNVGDKEIAKQTLQLRAAMYLAQASVSAIRIRRLEAEKPSTESSTIGLRLGVRRVNDGIERVVTKVA